MKHGIFLLRKVSVVIEDKLPVISFSTFFSIFHFEENSAQIWALGSAYKFVHIHALKAAPNAVEMYEQGLDMTLDYVKILSSKEGNRTLPKPPQVTYKKNHVVHMQETLYQVGFTFIYIWSKYLLLM